MKYTILGRNMEVTEGLREYIEKKFSKLDHYFTSGTEVNITLSKQRGEEKVEVTIPLKGTTIHAEESTSDMYQTIDILKDVVERQLRRNRKKIIDRKQSKQSFSDVLIEDLMSEEPQEDEEEEIRIVRSKRFEMKPMTPEEACFQMEMSGHTFYMFRNAEDEQIAVVYKRKDGDYGLIEQEF